MMKEIMALLKKAFPNFNIYGEEVKQGWKEPCFFVREIETVQQSELQGRLIRRHSFEITCFLDKHVTNDPNSQQAEIGKQLAELLLYLPDARLHGRNVSYQIVDGILHFLVDYKINLRQTKSEPKMQELRKEILPK